MTDSKKRSSSWAFLVYPSDVRLQAFFSDEQAGFISFLSGLHVPCAVSPLHAQDKWTPADAVANPEHVSGTLKKPHYHVFLKFSSLKSPNQVLDMLAPLCVSHVERVECAPAYTRYLCHLDDADKVQYSPNDVRCLSGFDPAPLYALTAEQERDLQAQIVELALSGDFTCNGDILQYIMSHELGDAFVEYVRKNAYFVASLLKR